MTMDTINVPYFHIEHRRFHCRNKQNWIYSDDGTAQFWPIDNYYLPGEDVTQIF